MLLNRTPVGAYGLAGGVEAAGAVSASALTQGFAESTFDVAADPVSSVASVIGDAIRHVYSAGSVGLTSTATGVVEGSTFLLGQGTPAKARAVVQGTWQNVAYIDVATSSLAANVIEAERIVTPPADICSGVAASATLIAPSAFSPVNNDTEATAFVHGDPAVLSNADGVLYVDASSFLVVGTSAVVSTIEYDYALTTSACFCSATGEGELAARGAGDCQVAATASGDSQQGFAVTAVAAVTSSATALSSSADRAAYAAADLAPGVSVVSTNVSIGVTASAKAWAVVSLSGDKIRDTFANANLSIAVAEANGVQFAFASGEATPFGSIKLGVNPLINDRFLAPEERTVYFGYEGRSINVDYENRLLEVA